MGYGQYSPYGRAKGHNPLQSETKPKRQVYPTGEIPHLWAHQTQVNARNPQGNFYFKGDVIYSYRDSFPVARLVQVGRSRCVLFNSAKYSVTTSQHQSAVRQAIPSSMQVFEVPNLGLSYVSTTSPISKGIHKVNLAYLVQESKSEFERAERARGMGDYSLSDSLRLKRLAEDYAKFFKVKLPKDSFKFIPTGKKMVEFRAKLVERRIALEAVRSVAHVRRQERWAKQNAEWQRQAKEREEQERLELPEKIERWRNGQYVYFGYSTQVPVMLRIKGDEVETSMGAKVPVDHARRGLKLVRAVRKAGRAYERNGHTVHLGNYAIDRIEPDGTLKAGCHVIGWPEIERISDDLDGRVDQGEVILSDQQEVKGCQN